MPGADSSRLHKKTKRSGASSAQVSSNCFQSSGISARSVNASFSSATKVLPRCATRQRTPLTRSCAASWSPRPDASANTSHDFSKGVSNAGGIIVAGSHHGLRAMRPMRLSPPCVRFNPDNDAVSLKPDSRSTVSHCERCSSGCFGRSSRSVKRHQPLVSPKTAFSHKCGVATSTKSRLPPGASRSLMLRSATRTSLTA